MAPFTPKPPVEKLPLTIRKELRDNYDGVKDGLAKKLSDLLGKPYTIDVNPNALIPYAKENSYASNTPGKMIVDYITALISGISAFLEKYGEDGKAAFNDAVSKAAVTITVNELGRDAPTITNDIKDGVFRILFGEGSLAGNIDQAGDHVLEAIDAVPRSTHLPVVTVGSIEKYNAKIGAVTEQIAKYTGISDIVLDPNFEENFAKLNAAPKVSYQEWKAYFGQAHLYYFDGLKDQLSQQGFDSDEMLREGLAEVLTSKTFKIRVVDKISSGSNETVIEDGVCYLQVPPTSWYANTSEMGAGLVNLL